MLDREIIQRSDKYKATETEQPSCGRVPRARVFGKENRPMLLWKCDRVDRSDGSAHNNQFSQLPTFRTKFRLYSRFFFDSFRFNIFICYKILFLFMCHISIIYSVYVYHTFGNISIIGHMLRAISWPMYTTTTKCKDEIRNDSWINLNFAKKWNMKGRPFGACHVHRAQIWMLLLTNNQLIKEISCKNRIATEY